MQHVAHRASDAIAQLRTEIARLQEAKRRALLVADERARENVALRAALADIIRLDQRERLKCIDVDSAGNTYEVTMIDGPCAAIARRALASPNPEPGQGEPTA